MAYINDRTKKKLEYAVKSLVHGQGISAVPPAKYAKRFLQFITTSVDCSNGGELLCSVKET